MDIDDLTPVWKALSDPTRRQILDLLRERPRTTGDLCDSFEVSRFAVMKHLSILEKAELIAIRRRGRERWNYLNAVPLQRIYERWLRPYEAEWASALLQLKRHVETKGTQPPMAEKSITTATLQEFHIEQDITIQAPPADVFEALTQNVSTWWTRPYFHSEKTQQLILEPKVGGRFYEDRGNDEGLLLAVVTLIDRPRELLLMGPMGMAGPVQSVIHFLCEDKQGQTVLKLSHRAVGPVNEELEAAYSGGWQALLGERLKNFVEHGTRYDLEPGALPDGENEE